MSVINAGLSYQAIFEVVSGARTKYYKEYTQTVDPNTREYRLQRLFMDRAGNETPEHAFEWQARAGTAGGSTGTSRAFQQLEYIRTEPAVALKVKPCGEVSHKNVVIDDIAKIINEGSEEQIYNAVTMHEDAALEDLASTWETKLREPPAEVGGEDGTLGLLYHARRSMTSGGVFVEQLAPARNGVYYVNPSGAVASDMYNISDISAARYARFRTLVATHRGVMGDTICRTIRDTIKELKFEFIPQLSGEKSGMDPMILWDDDFDNGYDDLCKALGVPRGRDYFDVGDTMVKGVPTVAIPSFKNHTLRPVFVVNMAEMKFRKLKGAWGKQFQQQLGHKAMAFPMEWHGQLWGKNPQRSIALIHGSFTTGT